MGQVRPLFFLLIGGRDTHVAIDPSNLKPLDAGPGPHNSSQQTGLVRQGGLVDGATTGKMVVCEAFRPSLVGEGACSHW